MYYETETIVVDVIIGDWLDRRMLQSNIYIYKHKPNKAKQSQKTKSISQEQSLANTFNGRYFCEHSSCFQKVRLY